ncbi:MAG: class I SAM-dependent methyltransferase [Pseudomonadota bacterium]
MRDPDENGWQTSAAAWIKRIGDDGDFSRAHVLDRPMLARVAANNPKSALDVGCGEGRFCRKLTALGVKTVGVDPIDAMVEEARSRDPDGTYRNGFAENLPFPDNEFDLVVSYLTLIDIDALDKAAAEMVRVLRPGGHLLIANLSSYSTSSAVIGKRYCRDTGEELRPLGRYLTEGKSWFAWDGIKIQNWHRPLSTYMTTFLELGLTLRHFDEPTPYSGPAERLKSYERMPYLMMMEWQK